MRKILLTFVLLSGCTTATGPEQLLDREWALTWIDGFATMPSGVATPTIRFGSDGRLSANTGCNSAGASYTVDGDQLGIGAIMGTKRACLDPRGNQLEYTYIRTIENARKFRIAKDQLELLDESGKVVARYRPVAGPSA